MSEQMNQPSDKELAKRLRSVAAGRAATRAVKDAPGVLNVDLIGELLKQAADRLDPPEQIDKMEWKGLLVDHTYEVGDRHCISIHNRHRKWVATVNASTAAEALARAEKFIADNEPKPDKPTRAKPGMSAQEAMKYLDLKPGDRVKVLRKAGDYENAWIGCWHSEKDDAVGNVYTVTSVFPREGDAGLDTGHDHYCFPAHILEVVKRTEDSDGVGE